jgi:hypothetical protein
MEKENVDTFSPYYLPFSSIIQLRYFWLIMSRLHVYDSAYDFMHGLHAVQYGR